MKIAKNAKARRGVVLVFTVLLIVPLIAFVALSIDLGLIAIAKTQAQNAADASAMAAARTINGDPAASYRITSASTNGKAAATANSIINAPIQTSDVNVQLGRYYYDRTLSTPRFQEGIPGPTTENWSLAKSDVSYNGNTYFGRVLGIGSYNVAASATAVHRPRDIALIMDFSGSMRFDSLVAIPHSGNRTSSNNGNPSYPQFGHYSSGSAGLYNGAAQSTASGEVFGNANLTYNNSSGTAIVDDFYKHTTMGSTPSKAFTAAPNSYNTAPGGDIPGKDLFDTGSNYSDSLSELAYGNTTETLYHTGWETKGYDQYYSTSKPFAGYTEGPNYWGKTFFIWPPDPRPLNGATPAKDWRQRFFIMRNTGSGVALPLDNNSVLWNNGAWRTIGSTVTVGSTSFRLEINYTAILAWIKETPNPFPPVLRSGRILYYDSIPSTLSSYNLTNFPPTWTSSVDKNQRFWKEYIDHVIGVEQASSGSAYADVRSTTGYGSDFSWGTVSTRTKPVAPTDTSGNVNFSSGYASGYSSSSFITTNNFSPVPQVGQSIKFANHVTTYRIVATQSSGTQIRLDKNLQSAVPNSTGITILTPYMDYRDNPQRPKMRLWFGPLSLVDFLGNYNESRFWWSGVVHEAPLWQSKIGIQAALLDMKNNHPNDHVALIFFSHPKTSANDSGKRFNRVRSPLGQNYTRMIDSLWFPLSTIDNPGTELRPFDAGIVEAPKGMGSTCYPMALMLAYNQFSSNSALVNYASGNGLTGAPAGDAGGLGRRGSQRLLIFQTDGMVNSAASAGFTNSGAGNSYFNIRQPNEYPGSSGDSIAQTNALIDQICAMETASVPGYSTSRKPVLVHCLAFGTLFEPATTDADKDASLARLQYMQFVGGKAGGEQPTATTPLASYKRITGTSSERIDKIQEAMTRIVQDGVQVSLIK